MKGLKNLSIFSKYDLIYSVLDLTKQNKEEIKNKKEKEKILILCGNIIQRLNIIPKVYLDDAFTGYVNKEGEFIGTDKEAIEVLKKIIIKL